ncbi:chaperone modulator CbpM [Chryseobacterium carnipullorum]|uniref:chaperone modulator CbpM n=1 Tax=Chryseobacterium carnipullorum TaxID=1124835 RepID=UPI0009246C6F|nr:chaperone modulator CbpM [Chryseobacterium carnipullorum]MDN5424221.1 chaperone modulator CbpM [Chryseobacterium sp.]MDN5478490.1 chaperone modulator CbpM [Chryseobacterium sp.]SHM06478.1 MerR HTH family regulatory protein [Chryseobacterium carnipullorum]HBV14663.1 MerR family transcriptional regulator [Chryseobacterium carnipullorum]
MSERISREELVKIYNIEITFFDELVDGGLLNVETENEIHYLLYEDLPVFERFTNWHYDLEINLPGLEVINDMLQKMEDLKRRNRDLMNKLSAISDQYEDI